MVLARMELLHFTHKSTLNIQQKCRFCGKVMKDLYLGNTVNLNWAKLIDYESTCSFVLRAASHIGRPIYFIMDMFGSGGFRLL